MPPMKTWWPCKPSTEAMLITRPLPCGIRYCLAIAWVSRNGPVRLVDSTLFQPSIGLILGIGAPAGCRHCSPECRPSGSWPSASRGRPAPFSSLLKSPAQAAALAPCAVSFSTAASSSCCLRAVRITVAPNSPSASAIWKPSPREPPVTMATRRSGRTIFSAAGMSQSWARPQFRKARTIAVSVRQFNNWQETSPTQYDMEDVPALCETKALAQRAIEKGSTWLTLGNGYHVDVGNAAFVAGLAAWIIASLKTGKTPVVSITSHYMASRQTNPLAYWGMIVANASPYCFHHCFDDLASARKLTQFQSGKALAAPWRPP